MTNATTKSKVSKKPAKAEPGKQATLSPEDPSANTARLVTRILPMSQITPAGYNPRKITEYALEGLKASLKEFGYAEPIVWNERTGLIVGGHQRFDALKAMGVQEVEVVVVDLDPVKERALNTTLNNPAIQGTWDDDKLQAILEELQAAGEDGQLDASFFDSVRLDELAATFDRDWGSPSEDVQEQHDNHVAADIPLDQALDSQLKVAVDPMAVQSVLAAIKGLTGVKSAVMMT